MSLNAIEGDVGGGKSFYAVNDLIPDWLRNSKRHIYTNLPVNLEDFLAWLTRSPAKQAEYRERLHFLQSRERPVFEFRWGREVWKSPHGFTHVGELKPDLAERCARKGWAKEWCELPVEFGDWSTAELQEAGWSQRRFPKLEKQKVKDVDEETGEQRKKDGKGVWKQALGQKMADEVTEFWWFTDANAVVVLDETADIWNALGGESDRADRRTLQSYINHHRHYKDDIYVFMQSRDDVDIQVRRKFRFVFYIQNMKNVNMFTWWALRGLRWPIQHFHIRQFAARKVLGVGPRGADFEQFEPMDGWKLWPTKRMYKNYRSFSAAATLRGKKLAAEVDKSTDLDSAWSRVAGWFRNAGAPLAVLAAVIVGGYVSIQILYGLANVSSKDVAGKLFSNSKTNAITTTNTPQTNATVAGISQPSGVASNSIDRNIVATATNAPPAVPPPKSEHVSFAGPQYIITSGGTYHVGDLVRGNRIDRILFDGIVSSGRTIPFTVLFRGEIN